MLNQKKWNSIICATKCIGNKKKKEFLPRKLEDTWGCLELNLSCLENDFLTSYTLLKLDRITQKWLWEIIMGIINRGVYCWVAPGGGELNNIQAWNYSDSALASQCMYIQLSIHELYTILQIRAYSREFGRWVAIIPMAEAVIRVKPVFCEIVFKVLMTFVFKSWMKFLYSNTNTGYSGMQDTHWLSPRSHWHSQFR